MPRCQQTEIAMTRRRHLFPFLGAAIALAAVSHVASAQTVPAQPVRIIVPCAAGTPGDLVARIIARAMSEIPGQRAYVENLTAGADPLDMDTADKLLADDHSILFNLGDCGDEGGIPQTTVSKNDQ
jgi:hypothetical protein